jgi:hypothetical protein
VLAVTTPLFYPQYFSVSFHNHARKVCDDHAIFDSVFMDFPELLLAGVLLCTGNIALKLAHAWQSHSIPGGQCADVRIAATIAPILGGPGGRLVCTARIEFDAQMAVSTRRTRGRYAGMDLRGLDFLFMIAAILGV